MTDCLRSNVSVLDARNNLCHVVGWVRGEAIFLERRGQRAAAVIRSYRYERILKALEDAEDAAALGEAVGE